MIKVDMSPKYEALEVQFSYPQSFTDEEMQIASEMELVAIYEGLLEKFGINNGSDIITNALDVFLHLHHS